ncbi:MAG: YihY/virulence factor BrkB family protein [Gemmataceae bacterium]|nr:YihY/virulence factor BrkB family protein [Gemmataceae bacterium]
MNPQTWWGLLQDTGRGWMEDKVPRLAAALAYYTILSAAPLLVIVLAIVGLVFDQNQEVRQLLVVQLSSLVGEQGGEAIQTMIAHASRPDSSIPAMIIGIALLLVGASGVFAELQDSLNTIWEVTPKPGRGILGILRDRFLSLVMVFGTGFLLLVTLVISTALAALTRFVGLAEIGVVGQVVNFCVSFVVVTLLFGMIYKFLPDVAMAWRDVWIGALATAFLFTVGKLLIGLYLGRASVGSAYGAAGSLVVFVVWVYYSSQILFLGAEFTKVYANRFGSDIRPAENAVAVTDEARAQQGLPRQSAVPGVRH